MLCIYFTSQVRTTCKPHLYCPVDWGCRIHQLHLCRGVSPPLNECPGYDTKQSDGEVPIMLELWGMQSTPSLSLLPGPFWPGVVALDRVLSMDQIELNYVLILNWIVWNRTVYMYKNGFGINSPWWLMWHKTNPNQNCFDS